LRVLSQSTASITGWSQYNEKRIKNEKHLETAADSYRLFTKTKIYVIAAKNLFPTPPHETTEGG
jgi:hypothetical protein